MSVDIGFANMDGFDLIEPDEPWGLGDFDVNDWDDLDGVGDCGCGLGAASSGGGFPWGAVAGGAVGLVAGVGLAVLAKRYLFKR